MTLGFLAAVTPIRDRWKSDPAINVPAVRGRPNPIPPRTSAVDTVKTSPWPLWSFVEKAGERIHLGAAHVYRACEWRIDRNDLSRRTSDAY